MNLLERHFEESVRASPIIDKVLMKLRTIGLFAILTFELLGVSLPAEAKQAGSK